MIGTIRETWGAFINWGRTIWLTLPQHLSQITQGSKLLMIIWIFEPLIVIGIIYAVRGLMRMKEPNYGTSLFLFYASGFLPFYLFRQISTRQKSKLKRSNLLPGATMLDEQFAMVLFNVLLYVPLTVLIFYGMWLSGIDEARPASAVACAIPIALLVVLATGVSLINNVVNHFIPLWNFIYRICTRGLLFLSGVIYISDLMPLLVRAVVAANPLTHAIDWFRLGIYGRYPHNLLDKSYLMAWALIALFLGLVLERGLIRNMGRE